MCVACMCLCVVSVVVIVIVAVVWLENFRMEYIDILSFACVVNFQIMEIPVFNAHVSTSIEQLKT